MERTGLRHARESVLPLWERTRLFRTYSPWLVPGAVQTGAYTRAVLRSFAERRELPDDVEDAVAVRTDRLRLLHEGGRRFAVLIEEPVLRNVIGGADVMAGQLGHLITVAALPSVSVGIIPMGLDRDVRPGIRQTVGSGGGWRARPQADYCGDRRAPMNLRSSPSSVADRCSSLERPREARR